MKQRRRGRPCLMRRVSFNSTIRYFKPQGALISELDIVELNKEELEAMRLKNIKGLDQKTCADKMHTSPATLQRILVSANKKVTLALVKGKVIKMVDKDN